MLRENSRKAYNALKFVFQKVCLVTKNSSMKMSHLLIAFKVDGKMGHLLNRIY